MKHLARTLLTVTLALAASLAMAQFYGGRPMTVPGQSRVARDMTNAGIRIDQRLNTIIPPDIIFTEADGNRTTTGNIFRDKPALLIMVFYNCVGVCVDELRNLTSTARGLRKEDVGKDYKIVVVSIDPNEGPELAATRKESYTDMYAREGTDSGWHFLTGSEESIQRLADSVGFRFYRDPKNGQITHPAGLMVVSPQRRLTRYFLSSQYEARPVLSALRDAAEDRVSGRDDRAFFLACVNVDPLTGQRSLNVLNSLRVAGVATVLILLTSIIVMTRNAKRRQSRILGDQ